MKLALISWLLLVVSCPGQDSNQASNRVREAPLNQAFELKIGQEAVIKRERLKVKFVSVLEDSRCPKGEQCIQAGKARVALQLTRNKKSETIELSTASAGQEVDYNGYGVRLLSLNPYPKMGGNIKPADYVLNLFIDKNPSGSPKVQ
jgi:hypothetical protein